MALSDASVRGRIGRFMPRFTFVTSPDDLPDSAAVPEEWRALLREQSLTGVARWPEAWDAFGGELHNAQFFLRTVLQRVGVLLVPDKPPALAYIYTNEGIPAFRLGYPPISPNAVPPELARMWAKLPAKFRQFYTTLHDGWTTLSANAGGPARLEDVVRMRAVDFGLDPDERRQLPVTRDDVLFVFHNGAGDYLGLDTSAPSPDGSGQGVIWFHEEPRSPETGQDFWPTLDAWFYITVEDADRSQTA